MGNRDSVIEFVLLYTFNRTFYILIFGSSVPTMFDLLRDTEISVVSSPRESSSDIALQWYVPGQVENILQQCIFRFPT